MTNEFLGKGWTFPIGIDNRGGIALSTEGEKIKQSIRLILDTARGERVMLPGFGCGIHDFTFAAVDTSTLTLIRDSVEEALLRWEPRIEVLSVELSTRRLSGGTITVTIHYKVRRTNTVFNLVYPFYLKTEGGRS